MRKRRSGGARLLETGEGEGGGGLLEILRLEKSVQCLKDDDERRFTNLATVTMHTHTARKLTHQDGARPVSVATHRNTAIYRTEATRKKLSGLLRCSVVVFGMVPMVWQNNPTMTPL